MDSLEDGQSGPESSGFLPFSVKPVLEHSLSAMLLAACNTS